MHIKQNCPGSDGFTALEVLISVAVLAVIARLTIGASETTSQMTQSSNVEAKILRDANRALKQISSDLRSSSFNVAGPLSYPHIYDDGIPGSDFTDYIHTPAPQGATLGDGYFGPQRSIVIGQLSDLDGDGDPDIDRNRNGIPELDGNGDGIPSESASDLAGFWNPSLVQIHPRTGVLWSREDIGYHVIAGPNGLNQLVRSIGGSPTDQRVLATGVDRIQFDDAVSSGFTVPSGAVQVQIFFRVTDEVGHVHRAKFQTTVRLLN